MIPTLADVLAARIRIRRFDGAWCVYQGRRRMSDGFTSLADALAWLNDTLIDEEWEAC